MREILLQLFSGTLAPFEVFESIRGRFAAYACAVSCAVRLVPAVWRRASLARPASLPGTASKIRPNRIRPFFCCASQYMPGCQAADRPGACCRDSSVPLYKDASFTQSVRPRPSTALERDAKANDLRRMPTAAAGGVAQAAAQKKGFMYLIPSSTNFPRLSS